MEFKVPLNCKASRVCLPSGQIPNDELRLCQTVESEGPCEDEEKQIRRRVDKFSLTRSFSSNESQLPTNTVSETSKVKWWLENVTPAIAAATVSNKNDIETVTNFVSESLRKDVVIDKSVNDVVLGLQRFRLEAEMEVSHHICGQLTALCSLSKTVDFNNKGLRKFSFLVLDTTIFMSHLHFIKDIINSEIEKLFPGQLFLLLPWIVLKELDELSSGLAVDFELQHLAQRASQFLQDAFETGKSQILTQSASNAMNNVNRNKPEFWNATNQFIYCCKHYKKIGKVALLSNDRALCQAARSRQVYGTKIEMLPSLLEKWFPDTRQLLPNQVAFITENETNRIILQEMKQILMSFLDTFVSQEMRNVYGQRFVTPPWKDVIDVLRFIETHWLTVFAHCMKKTAKIHLDLMINKFKIISDFVSCASVKSLLIESCQFLKIFENKSEYYNLVKPVVDKLASLNSQNNQEHLANATSQLFLRNVENSSPLDETFVKSEVDDMTFIKKQFIEVWDSMRTICCSLCKCCEVPLPSSAANYNCDKFQRPVKKADAYDNLPLFYPVITEIRNLIQRILYVQQSLKEKDEDVYCKLCNALENYFVRLNLVPESEYIEEMNPEMLRKFCSDSEKRKLVQKGLFVLEEYCERAFLCILAIKDYCTNDIILSGHE